MTDDSGSKPPPTRPSRIAAETPWYDLFSRGARDWLRHNEKVREAVRGKLPELLSGADLITRPENRTVLVPVRLLEHARFRLLDSGAQGGAGQGKGDAGQVLRPGSDPSDQASGGAGTEEGEVKFVLELKVDEIVDWLWEELKLPDLKPKRSASLDDPEYVREGLDKHGAHSRLDRRRTVREAVKRRAVQEEPIAFVNEDLRFRQLVKRTTPAMNAAVIFALDVSGSMQEAERKLAKTFFFFALQGIRRQYPKVDVVFLAHTVDAWEFQEEQFFQVAGGGGTVTSSVLRLALDVLEKRYDPSRYNGYLFYASDGENASEDRDAAGSLLADLAGKLNYTGYVQTDGSAYRPSETQMIEVFRALQQKGLAVGAARLASVDDVWNAIREFFREQAAAAQ